MLLALACALHFALGASVGLSVDEAHYALYARHLALSYFDHPPLVGWIQWPLVALDLPTAVLRLVPEALWLGTALGVHSIALQLADSKTPGPATTAAGFWAVLVFALSPLVHVLGIGLLPDTLLMFFSVALMALTLRLMQPDALQRTWLWVLLGVLLGLAGLSKYTAIFMAFALGMCLWLAHGWPLLSRRGLWLAVAIALALVMPVAVWNYQNHWISFSYQAKHGAGGQWELLALVRFLVVQLVAFGPLLLWAWVGAVRDSGGAQRSLRLFFLLPFGVLAALAGGGSSLPHWTAPAWVTLAPFAGVALARAVQHGQRRLIGSLVSAQVLACVALLGLMLSAGVPFVSGTTGRGDATQPSNPFADLFGWDAAGQRARTLAAENGLNSVAVQNWTLASRLGWYARPLPVLVLEDRFDQFDLWAGDLPAGGATLLVDWSQLAYEVPLGAHGFTSCKALEQQEVRRFGVPIAQFTFHACQGWSGDPRPRLLGTAP
ncbi:MAG: glycosyltransferase family 39 protein [Rhodoferax sp.]|nr:glycosyltransferase family 39 protein [Rhodoferax sp.]